ncbi:Ig-like domain-containing protein [Leptolyngbya ohadii]|uniref:Ig-like domain-containing protein n=1 Tax=Leptolyngbya ohadii TaxID=1962290 RepID=UPI00117B2D2E|nr:Ig-like domain-containing protein [Leptolyngbya ohadii]
MPTTTPTIDAITTDNTINVAELTSGIIIGGTADSGDTVNLNIGGLNRTATASNGRWSYSLTTSEISQLGQGSNNTVTATATNGAGETSFAFTRAFTIDTVPPTAPTIDPVTGDSRVNSREKGAGVTVTGTGEANSVLNLTWGGTSVTTTVEPNGRWSRSFTTAQIPADGGTTLAVTATDRAGNVGAAGSQAILVDTLAPTLTVNPVPGNVINSNQPGVLSGSTEAGSAVTLTIGNQTRAAVVAAGSGTVAWRYTLTSADIAALGVGEGRTVGITATDVAGNAANAASSFAVRPLSSSGRTGTPISPIAFGRLNRLRGNARDNVINGTGRNDFIRGNGGNDTLRGRGRNDRMDGGAGNDRLIGGGGRDLLLGGTGNDRLLGNGGDDILTGGAGNDIMNGGGGRDMFTFNALNEGVDQIQGFEANRDLIDLRKIMSRSEFSGTSSFDKFQKYVQLTQVGSNTEVQIDADGSGAGIAFVTLASIQNVSTAQIRSTNFVI